MSSYLDHTCTACLRTLPRTLEYFGPDKRGRYGLRSTCRDCKRARNAAWNKANAEKVRAANARYRAEQGEALRRRKREHYARLRDEMQRMREIEENLQ